MIEAVQAIHKEGVIIGDLQPSNIIIDPESLLPTIVDFESAWDRNSKANPRFFSRFVPGLRVSDQPVGTVDHFALAMTLYSLILPIVQWFEIAPDQKWPLLDRLTVAAGLPTVVGATIRLLADGRACEAQAVLQRCRAEDSPHGAPSRSHAPAWLKKSCPDFERVIRGIAEHLFASYETERHGRLWPGDYVAFQTNTLSIAYGDSGPLQFLRAAGYRVPEQVIDRWRERIGRIASSPVIVDDGSTIACPPGLFTGLAGIAYTCRMMGLETEAAELLRAAVTCELASKDPTFLYGMAGWGLVALEMYEGTGDSFYIGKDTDAGSSIVTQARRTDDGFYWGNALDDKIHLRLGYGSSGVALFLLHLFRATQNEQFLYYATEAMNFELRQGKQPASKWVRWLGDNVVEPYWLHGAAGIASVLSRFSAVLGREEYLDGAIQAADSAFSAFTTLPGQFEGLAGIGECFLDLWSVTHEQSFLEKAFQIAENILSFGVERSDGIVFPGSFLRRWSTCFAYGSSGVGTFLQRLVTRTEHRLFHDLGHSENVRIDRR